MADLDTRALRGRRRLYERRAAFGFEGVTHGTWHHLFQSMLRPFRERTAAGALSAVLLFALVTGAMAATGATIGRALGAGFTLTVFAWLLTGVGRFIVERHRVPHPPTLPPRADPSGVREPLVPRTDPPTIGVQIDTPRFGMD